MADLEWEMYDLLASQALKGVEACLASSPT